MLRFSATHRAGFTLVELLIVIAIIGILASVILGAINDARDDGVDAKIRSEMDSLAKRAAIEESQNFTFDLVCGTNGVTQSATMAGIIGSINTFASSTLTCNSDTSAYAVSVPLGTEHWCIDSTGNKTTLAAPLVATPTPQLACP